MTDISSYIQNTITPVRQGRICVDGRYETDTQESGMIARPGADFGYVMILLALNKEKQLGMSVKEIVLTIYDAITKNGDYFYKHTDHHALPTSYEEYIKSPHPISGCGHIMKAADSSHASEYLLDEKDVIEALLFLRSLMDQGKRIKRINLIGEHQEEGVLIIKGKEKTLSHQGENHMFFVYDKARDEEFMKNLVENLHLNTVSFEDFKRISEHQTTATLHILAMGLPIYEVNVDTDPHIHEVGRVQ